MGQLSFIDAGGRLFAIAHSAPSLCRSGFSHADLGWRNVDRCAALIGCGGSQAALTPHTAREPSSLAFGEHLTISLGSVHAYAIVRPPMPESSRANRPVT